MKLSFASTRHIALCFAALLAAQIVFAAPAAAPHKMHPDYKAPTVPPAIQKLRDPKYWSGEKKKIDAVLNNDWLHQPWTGDDAPYATARARIEREISTTPPTALVAQYAGPAQARPNDPLAQFAWAYAVHKSINVAGFSTNESKDTRFAAEVALAEAPSPHTYNYARLHYLIILQGPGSGGNYFLKNMAYRLLKKDPNDFPVLTGLVAIDAGNQDKVAQKEGYSLIQKLIKKYPEKPQVYDMLGGWHYAQYLMYHSSSNYTQSIANYKKALALYPATAARKAALPQVMAFLTTRYHQISGS